VDDRTWLIEIYLCWPKRAAQAHHRRGPLPAVAANRPAEEYPSEAGAAQKAPPPPPPLRRYEPPRATAKQRRARE